MKFIYRLVVKIFDRTIRKLFNFIYNLKWNKKIKNNNELFNKVENTMKEIFNIQSLSGVNNIYDKIYTEYESDPLNGLIDWSPSLTTLIAKEKDDCDGMSVLWKHLGKFYCNLIGYKIKSIDTYSFIYMNRKAWKQSHVMCLAEIEIKGKNKYLLFDYSNKNIYSSMEEIYQYYIDNYLLNRDYMWCYKKPELTSVKKMVHIKIDEPKGMVLSV